MWRTKWLGSSLNFQFSGIPVGFLDGNIPLLASRTCKSTAFKAVETETKKFCEWVVREINKGQPFHFPFLIFRTSYSGYGRNKLVTFKVRTNLLCRFIKPHLLVTLFTIVVAPEVFTQTKRHLQKAV